MREGRECMPGGAAVAQRHLDTRSVQPNSRPKVPLLLVCFAHFVEVLAFERDALSDVIDKKRNNACVGIQQDANRVARRELAPIVSQLASCAHHLRSTTLISEAEACYTCRWLASKENAIGTARVRDNAHCKRCPFSLCSALLQHRFRDDFEKVHAGREPIGAIHWCLHPRPRVFRLWKGASYGRAVA